MPRSLARALRALLYTATAFGILWLALIQAPMWLTRVHAERLLTDFQSIQPMKSDWPDAQRLMTRWHRWGHSNGPCSAAFCDYTISVDDPFGNLVWYPNGHRLARKLLGNQFVIHAMEHLGWRFTHFYIGLSVREGTIIGLQSGLGLDVSNPSDSFNSMLILTTDVQPRLGNSSRTMASAEQLDDHPDYEIGRPGGCTFCELEKLTYTPFLAHEEFVRLTSYNLSCITHLHACSNFAQILPAASEWHLYDDETAASLQAKVLPPITCRTDPRARARDASVIVEVDALSTQPTPLWQYASPNTGELDRVRIVHFLKGEHKTQVGNEVSVIPFGGVNVAGPPLLPEHLDPGKRYFLFFEDGVQEEKSNAVDIDRCGVLDSTPANLAQIKIGISQDIPEPPTSFSFF